MSKSIKSPKFISYLLEQGSLKSLQQAKSLTDKRLKFNWSLYSELARQRNDLQDELIQSINKNAKSKLIIKNWQRAIKYQYALHPLCTLGSVNFVGGRFNAGSEISSSILCLHTLYLAIDKDTALQEHLAQTKNENGLTAREIALTAPQSEAIVSISGQLDYYFDLTDEQSLYDFSNVINKIKIPLNVQNQAKKLNNPIPTIIESPSKLLENFLDPNWRYGPVMYDCPANSQIFGQLVASSGIQAILYPSKFTSKSCLAIFPQNFEKSSSYLRLDDNAPLPNVPIELNGANWRLSELTYEIVYSNRHVPVNTSC